MWGALATNRPSGVKIAQEKSEGVPKKKGLRCYIKEGRRYWPITISMGGGVDPSHDEGVTLGNKLNTFWIPLDRRSFSAFLHWILHKESRAGAFLFGTTFLDLQGLPFFRSWRSRTFCEKKSVANMNHLFWQFEIQARRSLMLTEKAVFWRA